MFLFRLESEKGRTDSIRMERKKIDEKKNSE